MNADTGQIYRGEEIDLAKERGENVVPVSERFARRVQGLPNPAKVARALTNLQRTRPDLSDAEREALALKVAGVK